MEEEKNSNKTPYIVTGAIALMTLICYFSLSAFFHDQEKTDDAFLDADVVPLAFQVPGRILHLFVQDNQIVKKGDLIAEIDPADYKFKVDLAEAELIAAIGQARIKSAQANLNFANMQLKYTKIYAPQDGKLSILAVREGQLIVPSQFIAQLVSNIFYVVANFKETQMGRIKIGQKAEFTIDSQSEMHFMGKIMSISPATGARFSLIPPDNASGNFVKVVARVPVKIQWTDQPQNINLQAGLSTEVKVYLK